MQQRKPDYPISPFFYERWSPRSFASSEIEKEVLLSLLEAARWAPSSMNEQPWYYLIGLGKDKELFLDCLVPENQLWAKKAPCLILLLYRPYFSKSQKENPTALFDCGLSAMSLMLEAHLRGLITHPMAGFHHEKTLQSLRIPKEYKPICFFAVGYQADRELLPPHLQEREFPKGRLNLDEICRFGPFEV
ncbi:MAG: nitroreductase family protein [Leptospiraceae bacterium]|nr:nitroreductase family protein [Leptospiraceae bacterium]MDW8305549.1 nitroreductase family protein [Leptospiraceae bacterium]